MNITSYLLKLVVPLVLIGVHATLGISMAFAEAPELFTPLPADQLKDVSPAQTQRIDQIKQRPTTMSVSLVRIAANALSGNSTRMSLPNAKTLNFDKSNVETRSTTDFTWFGTLSGVPGKATLVVHDGNITGTIRDDGNLYRVEPVGNGVHAVIKVDESRFPPDHPPSFKDKEKHGDIRPITPAEPRDTKRSDGPVGIDVLVAYTSAAHTAVSDIAATIQLAVAEANQSYQNSGVNIRLTLVDSFEISYSESGKTYDTILADFVGMADVNNRRNSSGADMAAMIINQSDYCGLADAIQANASNAFAIVHYDCATGYYSFAHELGHLQGARHDPANDPTTTPFAYGHGFQHTSPSPRWRTIMAYNCSPSCSRLQYWSNPNINYNGTAMGTATTNDNARVLNETATTVAGFRSPPVPGGKIACSVFNDGYANISPRADAVYSPGSNKACTPDGSASGLCRRWFGRCATESGEAVNFVAFDDGYTNITSTSDAIYIRQSGKLCIPDNTATGTCRKWFGRPTTASGKAAECYIFDDGYTNMVGPTDAIYFRAPNQFCKPDGTATGTCRRWFGRCQVK